MSEPNMQEPEYPRSPDEEIIPLREEIAALKAKLLAVECAECGKSLLDCECE